MGLRTPSDRDRRVNSRRREFSERRFRFLDNPEPGPYMSRVPALLKRSRSRVSHNSPACHAPEVSVIHPRSVRSLLLALGLILTSASAAAAQVGRITGTVTDATTGAAVEGVQVFAEGTGYGAVSQANGRYFIINVPPGLYTLVA